MIRYMYIISTYLSGKMKVEANPHNGSDTWFGLHFLNKRFSLVNSLKRIKLIFQLKNSNARRIYKLFMKLHSTGVNIFPYSGAQHISIFSIINRTLLSNLFYVKT